MARHDQPLGAHEDRHVSRDSASRAESVVERRLRDAEKLSPSRRRRRPPQSERRARRSSRSPRRSPSTEHSRTTDGAAVERSRVGPALAFLEFRIAHCQRAPSDRRSAKDCSASRSPTPVASAPRSTDELVPAVELIAAARSSPGGRRGDTLARVERTRPSRLRARHWRCAREVAKERRTSAKERSSWGSVPAAQTVAHPRARAFERLGAGWHSSAELVSDSDRGCTITLRPRG